MRNIVLALAASFAWLISIGGGAAQEQMVVMLEATNFPGLFVRHANFEAFVTAVESDQDRRDSAFFQSPALNGGTGVSFEAVNFPGRYLRHKQFRLVLEPNDGTAQFAADASFVTWPGPAGATGFEASNFRGYFVRHKNFMVYVDESDDSEQFHADSGFMVRRISNPMPIFADISQRCVIRYEAHVFPSRANSQDKPLPLISEDEVVMADRYEDGWFHILGANVPNGQGWIHDSYIGCN